MRVRPVLDLRGRYAVIGEISGVGSEVGVSLPAGWVAISHFSRRAMAFL